MAETIGVGIIGGGWSGIAHAKAFREAGGFKVIAVADLIPERRKKLLSESGAAVEYPDADALLADEKINAICLCVPTALHAPLAIAALRKGKHVLCEIPPAINSKQAAQMSAAADKAKKVLLYANHRRFGAAEQAAAQAIAKGVAGESLHVRCSWMRTRGIPSGTGWFTRRDQSGGGAMQDLGLPMFDLGWHLVGQPKIKSISAITHARFLDREKSDVEDSGVALIQFEGGASMELAASWAINQPPQLQGTVCRVSGSAGAVDVYTPHGAVAYRGFDKAGQAKSTPLKGPRVAGHAALARHFRQCIVAGEKPAVGGEEGIFLTKVFEAIYKSAASGKSAGM